MPLRLQYGKFRKCTTTKHVRGRYYTHIHLYMELKGSEFIISHTFQRNNAFCVPEILCVRSLLAEMIPRVYSSIRYTRGILAYTVYGIREGSLPLKGIHDKISGTQNVTLALKCMANYKFRALQRHDRCSDSQCVRSNA